MTATAEPVLVFEVEGVRLGLFARDVDEVVRMVGLTPLPGAPPTVEGIIDVRGTVVPVLDVRARLGVPRRPVSVDDQLVLARVHGRRVALRVDRAVELATPEAEPDERPPFADGAPVAGVVRLRDGLVLLQDLAAFLDDEVRRHAPVVAL